MNFKKIPESVLARSCLESSERLSHLQPTLSHLFFGCGQAASQMACARLNWGNRVKSSVVAPLRRIAEAVAPNGELVKSRRQAWRAGGELRSVSERAARAAAASTLSVGSVNVNDSTDELSPLMQSLSSPPLEIPVSEHCEGTCRQQLSTKAPQMEKSLSDLSTSSKSLSTPLRSPSQQKTSFNCARPLPVTSITGNGGSTGNILDEERSQKALIRTAKATQLNAIKQDLEVEAQLMKASSDLKGLHLKTKCSAVLSTRIVSDEFLPGLAFKLTSNLSLSLSSLETSRARGLVEWPISTSYNGNVVREAYVDFKMALDSVPHQRPPYKLSRIGTVCLDSQQSAEVMVTSGVPQGSVLGPILFFIYIDGCIHGLDCDITMFADDIKLWTVIRNEDDEADLQANLDRLEQWPAHRHLRLSLTKCNILRIGRISSTHRKTYYGLFRIAGSKKKVDTLQSALNTLRAESIIDQYDSFVIADALKQYLRRLPEPLLTRKLFAEWTAIQHISGTHLQVAHLCQTASKLPEASRVNAGYLFRFLQELAKNADKNRMTATNLGIILGPTLLAPPVTGDNAVRDDRESSKTDPTAGNNRQNMVRLKSASPDTTSTKSSGVSESLTCAGSRGGVIELLITYADEIFPELVDDDSYELENLAADNEDPFGEIEAQPPAGGCDSVCAKDLHSVDNSQHTPRLVPTTELGRRAQRCRNEFTRQGRVFRSLPQRLKVKHSIASTPSTPRSLPNWQAIFTGRPQSSQTSASIASCGNKGQPSPRSAPATGPPRRSLTPVFSASERLRNNLTPPTGPARGSLPDTNAHTVAQNRHNTALNASEVLSSTDATDESIQPRFPGGWSEGENVNTSAVGRTSSEDSNWKQPASRYGVYYGDSLSLDSHLTLEEVESQHEPSQCEDRAQKSFPHPRSDLQRRYQEWRRAMLDSSEQTESLGSRFFHGDLYDTLFTLQTLNNVSGLEDFLTRVRSVYEARTSIKKATTEDAGVAESVPCSGQVACEALQNIAATPGSTSENAPHATRRHSISNAASNELVDTALPRPINPALQRHYRKSLTSPSCMKPRRVSIPLSPELDKRPASSLSRMESSEQQCQKFTSHLTKTSRSSCAARLGLDASPIGLTLESRDRCFEAEKCGSNRLLETMAQASVRTSNTLPRTSADSSDVALTAPIILPLANDDMLSNFSIGRQAKQTSPTAAATIGKIQSTAASLPALNPKPCVSGDPIKKRTSCAEPTATSTFPSDVPI
nr:unnamed protein product [Spirometra erinaceieuropaei]